MSDSETAPMAETAVGLVLVVILIVAWYVGQTEMSLLSMGLLSLLALARTWVKHV